MQGQVLLCPLKNVVVVVYDSAMQKTPRGNHNRANIIDFTLGYVVAQFTNTTGHQNSDFFLQKMLMLFSISRWACRKRTYRY